MRIWNTQLAEEAIRHGRIIVLAGVENAMLDHWGARVRLQTSGNHCHLNKLRARAKNRKQFYHWRSSNCSSGTARNWRAGVPRTVPRSGTSRVTIEPAA